MRSINKNVYFKDVKNIIMEMTKQNTSILSVLAFLVWMSSAFAETSLPNNTVRSYLLGTFEPKEDPLFVAIPAAYSNKAEIQYLRKEAMESFKQMADAALKEGISLKIVSATRTFYAQKAIWEAKWNGLREDWKDVATKHPKAVERAVAILYYSSMPGTSRHHWGTDVDINSVETEYFTTGRGKKEYEWLLKNGATYGFCNPYTAKSKDRPLGYSEEKWHWSYLPIAKDFLRQYPTLISYADIRGFEGEQTAQSVDVIDKYVLGVNSACK